MSCSLQLSPFDFSFCFSFFLLLLFQFACGHKTSVILSGLLWPAQTLLISLHALLESTHHSSSAEALFWKIPSYCILSLFYFLLCYRFFSNVVPVVMLIWLGVGAIWDPTHNSIGLWTKTVLIFPGRKSLKNLWTGSVNCSVKVLLPFQWKCMKLDLDLVPAPNW